LLIKNLGAEASGYYQVVFALSAMYLAFLTNGIWSYFYPRTSAINDRKTYSFEVNNAIRFCVFGIMPFMTALFLFKDYIIKLVFSRTFIASRGLFASQLLGDMSFILFYLLGTSLLANMRLKAYLVFSVAYVGAFAGIFFLLSGVLGLRAITVSYFLSSTLVFLCVLYYHARVMELDIYGENLKLLAQSFLLMAVILFLGDGGILIGILKAVLFILAAYSFSTRYEKDRLMSWMTRRYKKVFGDAG